MTTETELQDLINETQAALNLEVPGDIEDLESSSEPKELTDTELQARAQGWKPGGVKSADEFLRAGPLYEEIEKRGKRIDNLEKKLEALLDYQKKQEDHKRKQLEDQLHQDKIAAIENGDVKRVQEVEKQMAAIPQVPNIAPEAQEFMNKYENLLKDSEIAEFVRSRDESLGKLGLPASQHMERLERELKLLYPNKFEGSSPKVSAVETNTSAVPTGAARRSFGFSDLSKEQKMIARTMNDSGVMTIDEYIKDLIKLGDLK